MNSPVLPIRVQIGPHAVGLYGSESFLDLTAKMRLNALVACNNSSLGHAFRHPSHKLLIGLDRHEDDKSFRPFLFVVRLCDGAHRLFRSTLDKSKDVERQSHKTSLDKNLAGCGRCPTCLL